MKSINTFWNWFQDNNQTIKNLSNETTKSQKNICFWLNKHLGYYCKGLDFIIVFPKKENEKAELIITANGNPEYFNQVVELVNHAPLLKHWKFTAFIQLAGVAGAGEVVSFLRSAGDLRPHAAGSHDSHPAHRG